MDQARPDVPPETPTSSRPSTVLTAYALPLAALGVAAAATYVFANYLNRAPFTFFWPAVLFAAWYGGWGPGLVVTLLAVLVVDYFLIPPVGAITPTDPADLGALLAFAMAASTVAILTARLRQAQARSVVAERAAAERAERLQEQSTMLADQALELELSNQQLQEQATELEARSEELRAITEDLEEASADAQSARERLVRVFEQAPVAVAVARGRQARDLVFELANPHYLELIPPGRVVLGRRLIDVVPEVGDAVLRVVQRVLDTGEPFTATEFPVPLDRDGSGTPGEYYFSLVYHPLTEGEAGVVGIVTVATEVTAQVRARQDAERANRAKSEFLAVMSHELRTPLNAIAGHTDLVEMEIHGPVTAAQREALSRIQRAQRHLLGLINDVLNYARLEAGRVEYRMTEVPLGEVARALEPLFMPQLRAKSLEYVEDCAVYAPVAIADRDKLQQVLLNLLSNAIRFTPEGGRIRVFCASGREGTATIAVEDTGAGIAAEKLQEIFEPFVQVNRGLTTGHEGTGLGLSISRDLVQGMGGSITVQSEVGRGSTFTVALPSATSAAHRGD